MKVKLSQPSCCPPLSEHSGEAVLPGSNCLAAMCGLLWIYKRLLLLLGCVNLSGMGTIIAIFMDFVVQENLLPCMHYLL